MWRPVEDLGITYLPGVNMTSLKCQFDTGSSRDCAKDFLIHLFATCILDP